MDDMDFREMLVENGMDQIFHAYDVALEEEIEEPVIFLVDCNDAIGRQFAVEWLGEEELVEELRKGKSKKKPTDAITLARGAEFDDCADDIPQVMPYLAGTFEEGPPADGFVVICVSRGGAGSFIVPLDSRPVQQDD